jgi:hypothetical protein
LKSPELLPGLKTVLKVGASIAAMPESTMGHEPQVQQVKDVYAHLKELLLKSSFTVIFNVADIVRDTELGMIKPETPVFFPALLKDMSEIMSYFEAASA